MSASKARSGSTRRPVPPVRKQRSWGWIAAITAVVLLSAAMIGYAAWVSSNAVKRGDTIAGVESYEFEGGEHVTEPVEYEQDPPVGGAHAPEWADCTGRVYPEEIPAENVVHSLEHGAVWVAYRPDLPQEDVDALAELVQGNSYTLLSPYEGLEGPVSLQSWGNQLKLDTVDVQKVRDFMAAYKVGPDTPEPGATCSNPAFTGGAVGQ